MNDKLLSMLGMCRRAGRLVAGYEKTAEAIAKKRAVLVLVSSDTAPRTEKEVRFHAGENVPVYRVPYTREQLSAAIGTAAGTVTLTDEGFANQAQLLIQQGGTNI